MTKVIDIPGYKVKKKLGAGGMATVYLALDTKLDRSVALKVLSPAFAENPRITKRFIKEAKTAAMLQHSNIVTLFDVGKAGESHYFAMEYLPKNLRGRMIGRSGIEPREALAIIKDVAKALSYAHKKGFIHRDIKPENIMFRKDGAVVLVDFGIVKAVNEKIKFTRTGAPVGTPQYMSPEQIRARKIDGRSDIYSLGIVLYELLTGKLPYQADDLVKLALQIADETVPKLPAKLKDFQPLIDKMMAKNLRERVTKADGLIRLIDALDYKIKEKTTKIQQTVKIKKMKAILGFTKALISKIINIKLIGITIKNKKIPIVPGDPRVQPADQRESWLVNNNPLKIFISYAREDIDKVRPINEALKNAGYHPWLDKIKISPGQIWKDEVRKAIKGSIFFLACLSENSVDKVGYVQKELKMGLDILDEFPEGKIFLIPIRLEKCDIPFNLQKIQYCDVFEDNGIENLLKAIKFAAVKRGLVWFSAQVIKGPNPGKVFKISYSQISIGRGPGNSICLEDDPKISSLHAKIERRKGNVVFSHLSEKSPSTIHFNDGQDVKLLESTNDNFFLNPGDEIEMGDTLLKVSMEGTNLNILTTEIGEPRKVKEYRIVSEDIKESSETKNKNSFENLKKF